MMIIFILYVVVFFAEILWYVIMTIKKISIKINEEIKKILNKEMEDAMHVFYRRIVRVINCLSGFSDRKYNYKRRVK